MRIKFLSVIVSFFLVSFAVTSCLDTEEIEYSPDATIHAFALDTIHGVNYKFTIDQLGPDGVGLIYNQDSLPVGSDTIIDRILIKTLTTTSGIITAKTQRVRILCSTIPILSTSEALCKTDENKSVGCRHAIYQRVYYFGTRTSTGPGFHELDQNDR